MDEKGHLPIPDPTLLTTQQLHREIFSVREVIETRINSMDKAIELVKGIADRIPQLMEKAISQLQGLHEEKFSSIQTQFKERDTRSDQTSKDNKVAIDAALQAAKEAVGEQNKSSQLAIAKSEAATTKQIDAIVILIANGQKALDDKIDDIKERLTTIEGNRAGQQEKKQDTTSNWVIVFGAIGVLFGLVGTVVAFVAMLKH